MKNKAIPDPFAGEPVELPQGHPAVAAGKVGVLLVNLGTPEGTDYWPMRRYLAEFLSDRRVIEWPRALWYPILYGIVLNTRPQKSGAAYRTIWNNERNEGPLRTFTRAQAERLVERIGDAGGRLAIDWAMRYGEPSIGERIEALRKAGCERVLVFPLYPQYAASTTATVNDKAFEVLQAMRWQPALRTVPPYHDDPAYIGALAASMRKHLATLDFEPELVLTSYHGIPQSYFRAGDPYHCQCQKTTRLLADALGWPRERLRVTFQSRFGPEEWLQPYTDKTLEALPDEGIKRVAVMNPGFVADCLETLEEIGEQGRESFLHHGGEKFAHIPCLNDSEEGMDVIESVVRRELAGWIAV
ncbi:MAG: ferrochelatase [Flavobacteriaceae bacterium]